MSLFVASALAVAIIDPAPSCRMDTSGPSIRMPDRRLAEAVEVGCAGSPTFRALVERIDRLRGFVYLVWSAGLHPLGVDAALRWRAFTTADGVRYLWIAVKPDLVGHYLVATIGHELQHAIEVLESRTEAGDFDRLFGSEISKGGAVFETDAAREVGRRVGAELRAGAAARVIR
jgi:hypothetical protein